MPGEFPGPAAFQVKGYEIDTLLSAGASGEVWLARAQGSGDQVALKRLRLRSEDARAKAESLVSMLHLIDHPHLLPVRELLPTGEAAVLVLDHAEGGSLDELLNARGGLDPAEVVTALAPVAEALSVAHEHGLVHGDVTPEAILFTADGRPLLSDIGVLGLVDDGAALGTHGYADPSGTPGDPPTPAGDVYGLAAVCYTALTGVAPRPGEPRRPLGEAVPGLPPGMAHAVGVGLQPVAARRPDAAQFADLLYGACDPAPVRFPVGLVLSDADIAAALSGSQPTDRDPAAGSSDPFARGLGATAADAGAGPTAAPTSNTPPGAPAAAEGAGGAHQVGPYDLPAFGGPAFGDEDDDEDRGRHRRAVLVIAGVLGFLLVVGAVVGGIALASRSRQADPSVGSDSQSAHRDGAGAVPAPNRTSSSHTPSPQRPGEKEPTASPTRVTRQPAPQQDTPEARWRHVLAGLDDQRARAFAKSDPARLGSVYEAGSDLLAKDRAEIDKCVQDSCHVEGLRFDVKKLTVVSETGARTVLEVVDQLQSYTVVSEGGDRTDQPAGAVTTRRITLVRGPADRWLISRIVSA